MRINPTTRTKIDAMVQQVDLPQDVTFSHFLQDHLI